MILTSATSCADQSGSKDADVFRDSQVVVVIDDTAAVARIIFRIEQIVCRHVYKVLRAAGREGDEALR